MMDGGQKITISTGSWLRLVGVLVLAYALFQISNFILVIIASIVIASAVEPAAVWARKKNIPRLPIIVLVYVSAALILAGSFYFILLPLLGEISSFIRTLTIYSNSIVEGGLLSNMFQTQGIFSDFNTSAVARELSTYLNELSGFLSQGVISSVSLVFGGVLNLILIVVISFYLAVQEDGIGKFLKLITPLKHEEYVVGLWRRAQKKIGLWMQGQIMLGVLVMVLVYIGLLFVGMPHALLLAVLAGVFELIPIFGATLAAIPAIFLAYTWGGGTTALIVAGIYIVIQQLENHVIYPLVVKKVVGVPPMISIIALIIGGTLAGFLGVVISVPIAAALMEFFSDIEKKKLAQASKSA